MATIQDVAKAAKVSVATVSRVLNNSPSVSEKKQQVVMRAIQELNYQPNLLGRNLRRTETKMILVLVPTIFNTFYAKVVKGIEDIGNENGYNVMLCNTYAEKNREQVFLKQLKNRLVDGIIFMATGLSKEALNEINQHFPIVQCCEYIKGANLSRISIDNYAAAYKAVTHLIRQGRKRIAMISSLNKLASTVEREAGYKKALENAGIAIEPDIILPGDYGFKSGLRAARQLLTKEFNIDGIFAISDMMAIGAMKTIKENGLSVPEDIAVVGFDDIRYTSMCEPQLTTISQPQYDLGCGAMTLLLKRIQNEKADIEHIVLEHELMIRGSTVI